ncbi:threonine synthase [Clostridium oryzae]|uniref:Threonine synthase n=1 Tax=Clostridium oryzae TaxID=1450648 RepID=A0A1V4IP29_9CLOT|nr:threonine synthase [Clostridium oryzae]OPJ61666.1 threonine synthase [Clostridium oryzae]
MSILYKSTRGNEKLLSASEAIIKGIADDGGLYVPAKFPKLNIDIKDMVDMDYNEVAYNIMKEFFTDFTEDELKVCISKAYDSKFDVQEKAPLKKAGGAYFLELFHGPTIAFKDMALSILPHLLTTAVKKNNMDKDIVILTATSGDTGKAALEGFSDIDGVKIIVFFPEHGVSEVQKLQMKTHKGSNTYVVGIEGNFDDAQNGVKRIFNDDSMKKKLNQNNYAFSSANSINIGRLIPQVVYYFYSYIQLVKEKEINSGEQINVVVPTGNFGNILAGYYAKKMGLPIDKLMCASNENKVLYDFISTGIYDKRRDFVITSSPSMDILISSNLERLLYHISGENTEKINELMNKLKDQGVYEIDDTMKANLKDFLAGYASEQDTHTTIKELYDQEGYVIDTHTAVAYAVWNKKRSLGQIDDKKTVIASTASPYKFPAAVMNAIDNKYKIYDDFRLIKEMSKISGVTIPSAVDDIDKREIVHNKVCDAKDMKNVVCEILHV